MPPAPPSPAASAGRALKLVAGLLAASLGVGVLAAGVVAPAVAAVGTTANGTVEAFDELPDNLAEQPLSQQSRILYADGSLMATFYYENRVVVPIDRISQNAQDAIVAIEDARFFEHGGVDPEGMGRALISNLATSSTQGASTLTQQWIKNVLIEQAVSELPSSATLEERAAAAQEVAATRGTEGYARKLREVKLAIAAEQSLSKLEILDRYLNIANFGDGQYGIETASNHYFNKSAADLTVAEAALLAGIVQQPVAFNPVRNPNDSTARRDVVLGRMLAQGKIEQATYDEAVATPLEAMLANLQDTPNGCATAGASAFFCDFAVGQLLEDPLFGDDSDERRQKLYRGGLTITTTLDPTKQQAAVETVNARVPNDGNGIAATIDSVQPGTGKILAMAQDREYTLDPNAPSTATNINYSVRASQGGGGGFQPGSNFKPFVLATWLASGRTLLEEVDSPSNRTWPAGSFKNGSCDDRNQTSVWNVGNSGDGGAQGGRLSVLAATYNSVNTAYSAIENRLPLCDVQAMATSLGVVQAGSDEPVDKLPSMVLGVDTVAPLDIANAYATFAAEGLHCTPLAIQGVVDFTGTALATTPSTCTQVMSADVANGVTYALKNTLVRGTARNLGLDGRVAAGKTGTTQRSFATWFTGYTPELATSVWIGHPEGLISLNGATIAGRRYGNMYGATVAAPTWREYMNRALEGTPATDFVDPPRSIIGSPPAPPAPSPSPSSSSGTTTQAPTPPADTAPAPAPAPEAPAPTEAPAAQ